MFKGDYIKALDDYRKARRSAAVQELLARLFGNPEDIELLSYDEVRQQLQAVEKSAAHLEDIPLNAIGGSVGRYHDFTRKFLPKSSIDERRWARVMATSQGLSGLPPIDVYQIGEVYFVKDGNHRVSVARQMGNTAIQAYVTKVETRVDLPSDITPDELIIKSEQVKFLDITKLDQLKPGSDLTATKPGAYPTLLEHIQIHRYYMGLEMQREIPYQESAAHWYEEVFQPVVNIIRKRGLLRDFPDRTATDLYLWAADQRAGLENEVGWDIGPEAAITDLSEKHSPGKRKPVRKLLSKLIRYLTPDILEGGPPPGTWREKLARMTVLEHLFNDLIIAFDDSSTAWFALDQAIIISNMENSRIHGIHIHPESPSPNQLDHQHLESAFQSHCQNAGVTESDFLVAAGEIGKVLCEHARFADLILIPLNHPPGQKPIDRLSSGISTLIRSCPVPILTVPSPPTNLSTILLAYDGSIKAREAMYLAAYFGTQRQSSLIVLTSMAGLPNADLVQKEAREYLSQYPLESRFITTEAPVADEISNLTQDREIDLILIGGYGGTRLIDFMMGSVVDQVLREIRLPVLICR
ncbi:MAG: universal stress protein [Anaerolineales bacterium]|nr:universal stress protein [Anaerolineales bacterium]